ncbi:carbohydrate sulfotransferase 11-like [Liolophura sinensis]|uniref:carbohydrate sulfotransferase 11-like n=1 Tax=Liolophura sinensis TaxID=3198878 RepID=UPI0031599115
MGHSNRKTLLLGAAILAFVFIMTSYNTTLTSSGNASHLSLFSRLFQKSDSVYRERRETLLKACKGKISEYGGRDLIGNRLSVDEKHKLLYCPIAKVASSFWKRVFQVSSGTKTGLSPFDVKTGHDNSQPTLGQYPFGVAHWTLKNFTTFLFVREPYSRLLACYIDKFFTTNPSFWNIGKVIIRNNRKNPDKLSLSCGHNVTFPEFIKHVIRTVETKAGLNLHWMPMYMVCSPCEVEYDLIGKLETISQDLNYILEKYIGDDIIFRDMESESEVDRLEKNVYGLYGRYNSHAQNCMSLPETLLRLLRKEQVRGILNKSVEFPDWFSHDKSVSKEEVKTFILQKYKGDSDKNLRKLNRQEALLEAYSQVPMEDMLKLQTLYKPDFDIFGYDPQPAELFEENVRKRNMRKFYFP